MIKDQIVHELCKHYALGEPLAEMQPITGGLLHKIFYLKTTLGEFAIKCVDDEGIFLLSHNLLSPERAEQVAAMMQRKGVPTVVALQRHEKYTYTCRKKSFLIMPWLSGETLSSENITSKMTSRIGKTLALIQECFFPNDFVLPHWSGFSKRIWIDSIIALSKDHQEIAEKLQSELPRLIDWSEEAARATSLLNQELLLSHRDLDPKNVLWQDSDSPIVLDWEYAGLIHPTLDVFIVALNWSEVLSGHINLEKFVSLLEGYQELKMLSLLTDVVIDGYKGYCLDWLFYNLNDLLVNPAAAIEIERTLTALFAVDQCQKTLIESWQGALIKRG